jgi:pectate lyase
MRKYLLTFIVAVSGLLSYAQSSYDLNEPFGFCTRSSRTDATSTYDVTGGGCYTYPIPDSFTGKVTTLKSNGQDMKGTIQNAIKNNDVVILDGADGEFIVSSNIGISGIDKTIIGINNAIISTKWYVTDEIKKALNDAGVPNMSTSGGGGTLPNGQYVSEEAEYNTRKIIIEMTGDNSEDYRKSGCISLSNCQNIIIRNITFKGPGAIDVGGYDLISCTGSKNCWVDHCEFMDGMDGNFDITQKADFNTVSWCVFRYTDRSYMHQNTNLIGSSDSEATGFLNTTFAFNWWAAGCNQRMPMGRVGKIHMLNNYYSCSGASLCMNPRKNSEFLIEGNYFASGVKNCYKNNDATAVTWADNNVIANTSVSKPSSFGSTVTVPYSYTVATTNDVPDAVQNGAGATLPYGDSGSGTETEGSKGNILWAMSSNTNAEVSSALTSEITTTTFDLGSNLSQNNTSNSGGITFRKFTAENPITAPSENDIVTFSITSKSGYKFKATDISFYACKFGTDNGTIDVKWTDAGGTSTILEKSSPSRNTADATKGYNYYTLYELPLTGIAKETEGTCTLKIYLYNVGFIKEGTITKKDLGLAQVMIKGTITEATGISTPVIIKGDGHIYNLRGQRVDENYKGIVIKNGKKYIQK